jgi:hypothetical protein
MGTTATTMGAAATTTARTDMSQRTVPLSTGQRTKFDADPAAQKDDAQEFNAPHDTTLLHMSVSAQLAAAVVASKL